MRTTHLPPYERGLSADAIASKGSTGDDFPYDPDDFRRCERLLRARPWLRVESLPVLAAQSPVWARLLDRWDLIVATMEREVPGVFDRRVVEGRAPEAYRLISECQEARP